MGVSNMSKTDPTKNELDARVDRTRSLSGLGAVVAGDIAIVMAAILGIIYISRASGTSSNAPQIVAILSGGFTAIGTMTTAYFGIKSISNTAQNVTGTRPAGGTPTATTTTTGTPGPTPTP
jgi:hypothetical protein